MVTNEEMLCKMQVALSNSSQRVGNKCNLAVKGNANSWAPVLFILCLL